jgi:hypothetical protein
MPDHPMQPVVLDEEGEPRFKENAIVQHLLEYGGHSLNDLARLTFSQEDREQFAQLIGYSVSGFADLSYASDRVHQQAERAVQALRAEIDRVFAEEYNVVFVPDPEPPSVWDRLIQDSEDL